jgi:hypothetical protein
MSAASARACAGHALPTPPGLYRPRHPERTVLHAVVREHLETWLALQREGEDDVPGFVERDFRKYITCGVLAHGFGRARCPACGHDFLVAFSCRARAVCPSCNARRMAETAAHLVDHVFPRVPVRQWVLSVPKRLRYFLARDPRRAGAVLRIFLRVIEESLRQASPGAGGGARLGAVSFVHRFGASLNAHLHYHCCVIDGVFAPDAEGRLQLHEATGLGAAEQARVEARVRARVLTWMVRERLLEPEEAQAMRAWEHGGGFSVDATVRVEASDRAGLERLLRYCARGPLALERLERDPDEAERLHYRLPKPTADGCLTLTLTPLELLSRLAALIPPSRVHRHRYAGVLAPNSPWRAQVTAWAKTDAEAEPVAPPSPAAQPHEESAAPARRSPARYLWAMLLARIYEAFPLVCPLCQSEMRLIAFVTDSASVIRILEHLGEPTRAPPVSPARGPPAWEGRLDQSPAYDPTAPAPVPEYELDQRVSW